MARETIAGVKREAQAQRGAMAADHKATVDQLVGAHEAFERELRKMLADKEQALSALRGELSDRNRRIDELFQSNNEYQAEARAARAEVVRLQAALTDASRVIAALGQRAEG